MLRTSTVITSKAKYLPSVKGNTMQCNAVLILHNPGDRYS